MGGRQETCGAGGTESTLEPEAFYNLDGSTTTNNISCELRTCQDGHLCN